MYMYDHNTETDHGWCAEGVSAGVAPQLNLIVWCPFGMQLEPRWLHVEVNLGDSLDKQTIGSGIWLRQL